MRTVSRIPSIVTHADGSVTCGSMHVMPPKPGTCKVCARDHDPDQPHDVQTLFYQITFNSMIGRSPTWADAMAHCSEATRAMWRKELEHNGHWSEPPAGEQPVAHHGVEEV